MVRRLAHGKVHGLGAQLLFEDGDAGNRAALADQAHGRAPLGLDGFDERAPCRVLQGPEPPGGAVEDVYVDCVGRAHALKVLVDRAHELRLDGMHVLVRHDPHAHGRLDSPWDDGRVRRAAVGDLVHGQRWHAPQGHQALDARGTRCLLRQLGEMRALVVCHGAHVVVEVRQRDTSVRIHERGEQFDHVHHRLPLRAAIDTRVLIGAAQPTDAHERTQHAPQPDGEARLMLAEPVRIAHQHRIDRT